MKDRDLVDLTKKTPQKSSKLAKPALLQTLKSESKVISRPNLSKTPSQVKISEALKSRYSGGDSLINLDEFLNKQTKTKWDHKELKPVKSKLEDLMEANSKNERKLPRSFARFPQKVKKEEEIASLSKLIAWRDSALSPKDKETEELPKVPKIPKVPKKTNVLKKNEMFSLDKFLENEKRLIRKREEAQRKAQLEEEEAKRQYKENMKLMETRKSMTDKQKKELNRKRRFNSRNDHSEFYKKILDIDVFNIKESTTDRIPTTFEDGKMYLKTFKSAFFEEVKGEVSSCLQRNDMSKHSVIEFNLEKTSGGLSYLTPGKEHTGKVSFFESMRQEDLILIVGYGDSAPEPNFAEWSQPKVPYCLGIYGKENLSSGHFVKVSETAGVKFEHGMVCYVVFVTTLNTLLREFKMIKQAEFLELGEFILNPSNKVQEQETTVPAEFYKKISFLYNESQNDAIRKVSSKLSGITLLQGPPGTGKTHTVLGILSAFLVGKGITSPIPRVLVCAPSNAAVDEIAHRAITRGLFANNGSIRKDLLIVRSGNWNLDHLELRQNNPNDLREPPEAVKRISLGNQVAKKLREEGMVDTSAKINELKNQVAKIDKAIVASRKKRDLNTVKELEEKRKNLNAEVYREVQVKKTTKDKRKNYQQQILSRGDVVFATLSGAGSKELQDLQHKFDFVIIDEACQSVEPSTLIPFQYGAKHVVLVGDPCQLAPTTFARNSSSSLYSRSLFERLLHGGSEKIMLEIQYRMVKEIREFPSNYFYQSRLRDAENNRSKVAPKWIYGLHLLFINLLSSKETRAKYETSIWNRNEAEFIKAFYGSLTEFHGKGLNIGVITPYRKQVHFIRELLSEFPHWKKDIEVNTVDGFQGREKDLIIFSTVRSGNSLGFLSDFRRMNVGITRAKFGLWVLGNSNCLRTNPDWKHLLNHCENHNSFLDCANFGDFQRYYKSKKTTKKVRIPTKRTKETSEVPNKKAQKSEEDQIWEIIHRKSNNS